MSAGWKTFDTQNNSLNIELFTRRRSGRPLNRLLDGYNREAETGHLLA